jgi:hypothetical protein
VLQSLPQKRANLGEVVAECLDDSGKKTKKRTWNKEEDEKLIELVQIKGPQQWNSIAESLCGRTGK